MVSKVTSAGAQQPTGMRRLAGAASFGVAAIVGFLVAECIIIAGLYAIYGELDVPGDTSGSPGLLAVDVLALVFGVAVSVFLNEKSTFGRQGGGS